MPYGHPDLEHTANAQDPVHLADRAFQGRDVFQYVTGPNVVHALVREGPWHLVQVVDHIHALVRVPVHVHEPGAHDASASEVHFHFPTRRLFLRTRKPPSGTASIQGP